MKIIYLWVLLIITALLYSCQNEDECTTQKITETGQVRFSITPQTYATDTRFEEGDQIGIYAVKQGVSLSPKNNYADNRKYIYNGNTIVPASADDAIYFSKGQPLEFYAYYPYRENIDDATCLDFSILNEDQQSDDLLWATNMGGTMINPISLDFKHKLSLVEITFNSTSGNKPTTASIHGVSPSMEINLQTGEFITPSENRLVRQMRLYSESGTKYVYRSLQPGQTIFRGDTLFSFDIDGSKRAFKALEDVNLQSGTKHVFECSQQYRIEVHSEGGGNTYGGRMYDYGQQVELLGEPNPGYSFLGWFEEDILVYDEPSYTFVAQKDRKLTARFEIDNMRKISVRSSGGGSAQGDGIYAIGEICTVRALEYPSYYFIGWRENGRIISSTPEFSFEVTGDRELEAFFYAYDVFVEVKFYGMGLGVDTNGPIAYGSAKVEAYYMKDGQKQTYYPGNPFSVYISFGYTAANPVNGGNLGYMTCSKLQLKVNSGSGSPLFRLFYWDNPLVSSNRMSDVNTILNMRLDRSADQSSRVYTFLDSTVDYYREYPWSGGGDNYTLIKTLTNQRNSSY